MSKPRGAVLDWLLEKQDPGVRFFALRDLLGAPEDDPQAQAARRATVRASPVREILEAQEEGYWVKPGAGYGPKYRGTVWQVIFLGQFGADGRDRRVRKAANYVLEHSRSPCGGFSMNGTNAAMVHCLQGNLCASMLEMGFGEDLRLKQAVDWLARSIVGEGIASAEDKDAPVRYYRSGNSAPGFRCSANEHLACAWGAVPALDALRRVPARSRTAVMRRAIQTGVEFLLGGKPAAADYPTPRGAPPSRSWFQFGYPMGYVTDVLRNAEVLVGLGHGRHARLAPVAGLILSKRGADGRWRLEYSYSDKTWFEIEKKRQPSKWVTLRALRVLQGMGVTV